MIAIMRSEWLKLRTTALPWVLTGIALSLLAFLGGGSVRLLQLREKLVTVTIGANSNAGTVNYTYTVTAADVTGGTFMTFGQSIWDSGPSFVSNYSTGASISVSGRGSSAD